LLFALAEFLKLLAQFAEPFGNRTDVEEVNYPRRNVGRE
jgi:hypothetical protein